MSAPMVWFERHPLAAFEERVRNSVVVLGPSTETPEDPFSRLGEARAIIAGSLVYGSDAFDRAPHLQVLCRTGIGVDKIDLEAATERGIVICNAPDGPTVSTAEHTLALMLAVAKNLSGSADRLRSAAGSYYEHHNAVELDGKLLGLIGFGRIARRVATMALGLGMNVTAFDPFIDDMPEPVTKAASFNEVLAAADVVSVHVPLVEESRHMFAGREFAAMKPGSIFINAARGGLVDHDALSDALRTGQLSAAGLDVTDPEPLPPEHPLLHRFDTVVTPHIASATVAAKHRIFETAFTQALEVIGGTRPAHVVNGAAWDQRREEHV